MIALNYSFSAFILCFDHFFTGFLKPGQKYKNIFVGCLVQMKTLKFAFEINWPLALTTEVSCLHTVYLLLLLQK